MQRQYTAHSASICAARALESKPALARHAQLPPSLPGVFSAEAHLNTPGKLGGNWAWRAKAGFDSKALAAQIEAECAVYCRSNADAQNVKELAI